MGLVLMLASGPELAAAQSNGFSVAPLDPVDPVDPLDPLDPEDPEQGQNRPENPGRELGAVAIQPEIGLVQTPIPDLDSGFIETGEDGNGGFVQVNPGGQDGVALIQTRNMMASDTVSAVAAAPANGARLRALDKTVGQTADFDLQVGETVVMGRLAIRLGACRYPVDNPASDAFAQIQIADLDGRSLFDGWMVASSPALMALEHPRYDVWVLSCNGR